MQAEYVVGAKRPGLVLQRFEPVRVTGPAATRSLLAGEADRFLPEQLEFSEYTAVGQLLKNASLVISDASFDHGWAHIVFTPASQFVGGQPPATLAASP
jgi:hypothetical protein